VLVNGTVIGNAYWNGDIAYVQEMNIDLALLREGVNTLAVQSPGDTGAVVDSIYLNWFEISYLSRFAANADELALNLREQVGSGPKSADSAVRRSIFTTLPIRRRRSSMKIIPWLRRREATSLPPRMTWQAGNAVCRV
jgi:hypothetical protein